MGSSYRLELNRWLSQLDVKSDCLLDLGGSQENLKGRTKSWDVAEYLIADLPNPHVGSPKPDIEIDLNRAFALNAGQVTELSDGTTEYEKDIREKFDLIFCLEVFDYVWATETAFDNLYQLMKKGGTAWVSFPTVYPLHQPIEDDALRYMPAAVEKLADSVGLEVVQMIKRRPETNKWQEFFYAERMRGAKHQDHSFTGLICEFRK